MQAQQNKQAHITHGNTTIRLQWQGSHIVGKVQFELSALLPEPKQITYSRDFLLQARNTESQYLAPSIKLPLLTRSQTTPLFKGFAQTATPNRRSGRRRTFIDDSGRKHFYRSSKPKVLRTTPPPQRIQRIKRIYNLTNRRAPPPRGTPGAEQADEECTPPDKEPHAQSRGAGRRRARRALYRSWRRQCKQCLVRGAGSRTPAPCQLTKATPKRAKWFRQALLWQHTATKRHERKKRVTRHPTTPPLPYASKLRIGSLNVQGFADTLKLKTALQVMERHRIDVLMLTETKSTSYYSYVSEEHLVILSGNNRDKHAGVGAIITPHLRPYLMDVIQFNNRIIHLCFKKQGGAVHVVGAYAPHSGRDFEEDRQPFWEQLEEHLSRIPHPEPLYLTGDFNVRFQASHRHDEGVTGPHTYGKGPRFIDHTATSNRSLCVKTMQSLGMLEAASYITPIPSHQITYRDKAAPPASWEQFIMDPLILQQFYSQLHQRTPEASLEVAALVRSYLDLPELLPPTKNQPHPDPTRFQRLDHTFVRAQWLHTVNSCRSKLFAGFPSDHYPLVTEVQVKLAAKNIKKPKPRKYDFSTVTPEQKEQFNQRVRKHLGLSFEQPPDLPTSNDHTAECTFYTDGSGTRGRCTAASPAGWGWCTERTGEDGELEWTDASGPVITDPDHTAYLGARVGSNNTAELSAIAEALLYAHEQAYHRVIIRSDSQWAINVITGKWRPKTHHNLINCIRSLLKFPKGRAKLFWVKGHAGDRGNERADRLADKGKESQMHEGGRSFNTPPRTTPQTRSRHSHAAFTEAIQAAAQETFKLQTRHPKKPWITDATLTALQEARAAEAEATPHAKSLRNKAKRLVRKDRIKWIHDRLVQDPGGITKDVWRMAKQQKRGFVGKRSHLVVDGKPIPWSRSHEAFRDHLQNKQWAPRLTTPQLREAARDMGPNIFEQAPEEPLFTIAELQTALTKLKKNKAPGPDGITNELYGLLDTEGELNLLQLYNDILTTPQIPEEWYLATVVSIFKGKGSDTDVGNYRPISLLNASYKILASMIQTRLAKASEPKLRKTQYGFRAERSTTHPLFILRRAMEWSQMTDKPLQLLFLDWRQAFDSLDHTAMLTALRRFGVSQNFLQLIEAFYSKPVFQVHSWQGTSCTGQVGAGIRQGCPLSPYLFIMVLSVIMHDVDNALLDTGVPTNTWSVGNPTYDLEYADDTLLISLTTPQLQSFLTTLEREAARYGMSLNETKTEHLTKPGTQGDLFFQSGEKVPKTSKAKYLGAMISWDRPFHEAFYHRLALAESDFKKLRLVWNSNMPRRRKLYIFHSTIVPSLLYGLDSLSLTDHNLRTVNGQYYRFLRRVMGIKAAYYSRIPNEEVWNQAGRPHRAGDLLNATQHKMLVEVYSHSMDDPLHNVVFCSALKDRITTQGRRRGKPIPYWLRTMIKRHYPSLSDHTAGSLFGPQFKFVELGRTLRQTLERAPKRARPRAWPGTPLRLKNLLLRYMEPLGTLNPCRKCKARFP